MTVEIVKTVSEVYDIDDEDVEGMEPEEILEYVQTEINGFVEATVRAKIEETIITDDDGEEIVVIPGNNEWEDS